MTTALMNLRLALAQLLDDMEELPPFSADRVELRREAETLRGLIRRLEERRAA